MEKEPFYEFMDLPEELKTIDSLPNPKIIIRCEYKDDATIFCKSLDEPAEFTAEEADNLQKLKAILPTKLDKI